MASSINNNVNLGGVQKILATKRFENIVRQVSDYLYNETPPVTEYNGFDVEDSNNRVWAGFEGIQYATGTNEVQMTVLGNSGTVSRMYVQESSTGAVTYGYGQQIGTSYIKIPRGAGNAVLFCWGSSYGSTSQTITFPTAFNNNDARVLITTNGANTECYQALTANITATNFQVKATGGAASQAFCWFAIGTADM